MGKPGVRKIFSPEKEREKEKGESYALIERNSQAELQLQPLAKAKKKPGARLWMRLDATGNSEVLECDKQMIMKRLCIPARDLRILGPVFSHSSTILDILQKAMANTSMKLPLFCNYGNRIVWNCLRNKTAQDILT